MPVCIVSGCDNDSNKEKDLQTYRFYSFPRDREMHQKWLSALDMNDKRVFKHPKINGSVVCSAHFAANCFTTSSCRNGKRLHDSTQTTSPATNKNLRTDAVPTENLCKNPANSENDTVTFNKHNLRSSKRNLKSNTVPAVPATKPLDIKPHDSDETVEVECEKIEEKNLIDPLLLEDKESLKEPFKFKPIHVYTKKTRNVAESTASEIIKTEDIKTEKTESEPCEPCASDEVLNSEPPPPPPIVYPETMKIDCPAEETTTATTMMTTTTMEIKIEDIKTEDLSMGEDDFDEEYVNLSNLLKEEHSYSAVQPRQEKAKAAYPDFMNIRNDSQLSQQDDKPKKRFNKQSSGADKTKKTTNGAVGSRRNLTKGPKRQPTGLKVKMKRKLVPLRGNNGSPKSCPPKANNLDIIMGINDSLSNELASTTISILSAKLKEEEDKVEALEKRNRLLKRELDEERTDKATFNKCLGMVFSAAQIRKLKNPLASVQWTTKDIIKAIDLRNVCPLTYNYLKLKLGYPIPAVQTLQKHLKSGKSKTCEFKPNHQHTPQHNRRYFNDSVKDNGYVQPQFEEVKSQSCLKSD